jgi:membrane-associated phospholipid phosphatase
MAQVRETSMLGQVFGRLRGSRRWRSVPRELALVAGGVALYFGVRGYTHANTDVAAQHAHDIVTWEQDIGIYVEPSMQDLADDAHWLTTIMNWVYIWGHWPVIAVTLLWLVLDHPAGYRVTRNAMLISGAAGLFVFALYPVAPPRLAHLGLVDTVTTYSSAYRVLQPQAFVNQYAAMPSLHSGWDLLVGMAIITAASSLALRLVGFAMPVLMAFAVVATANHYVVDVVAGIALVLVGHVVALWLERRRHRRRTAT